MRPEAEERLDRTEQFLVVAIAEDPSDPIPLAGQLREVDDADRLLRPTAAARRESGRDLSPRDGRHASPAEMW